MGNAQRLKRKLLFAGGFCASCQNNESRNLFASCNQLHIQYRRMDNVAAFVYGAGHNSELANHAQNSK